MHARKIVIVARGDTEADLENAINEAIRLVKQDYAEGGNSNETSGFYFNKEDNVPDGELPA